MPRGRVAVVHRNPEILELFRELLSDEGYAVAAYRTDGATHAKLRALQPRLVVLDAGAYEAASGWDVLNLLHADPQTQRIPVLITTVDQRVVADKLARLNASGYDVLELPARMVDLLTKVAEMLARAEPT